MVAFLVNLSIFMVIGKTSPVTYNVLGHFKLCSVLAGGFIFFHDPLNFNQVCIQMCIDVVNVNAEGERKSFFFVCFCIYMGGWVGGWVGI